MSEYGLGVSFVMGAIIGCLEIWRNFECLA